MNWTKDQKKIIDARNCNLLVSAAAGSGKTAVLVERIIQMVADTENPMDIDKLLVVTFTKAAAAQMKEKIAKAIDQMLEKEPENEHFLRQMNFIHRANILTIDSFCYQVVKDHFYVLGIDPGIRVGEAGEIGLLREEVLEQVIEEFYEQSKDFVEFSDAFSSDKDDEKIEDYILKIYDVCASYPRPEEWTRQAREALHITSEEEYIHLPFVQHYFAEVHNTAKGIKEQILGALKQARDIDGPLYMEKALLEDIVLVDSIISARNYTQFSDLSRVKFANIGRGKKGTFDEDIADRIKKLREEYKKQVKGLLSVFEIPFTQVLEQIQKQEPMLTALLTCTDVFRERFLQAKIEKNLLEFSDVEHFALQVLCKEYDEAGNPLPSEIAIELSESFEEILIDEYQDSNYLQEAILTCVSKSHQGKNNIFMVGDVKQSIYSFRMARPDLFMDKYHTYSSEENAEKRKLLLKNNFRSRANVLESINYIFNQIMGEDLGGIDYTEEEALVPGKDFFGTKDECVELLLGESKDFEFLDTADGIMQEKKEENLDENLEDIGKMELEATMVARRILRLMNGVEGEEPFLVTEENGERRKVNFGDIVILFRAPSAFQQIFAETLKGFNIPVRVQNEKGYFDTVEIRLLLSVLRAMDNPYNDVEFMAVLRSYFCGMNSGELAVMALLKRNMEKEKGEKVPYADMVKCIAEGDEAILEKMKECLGEELSGQTEALMEKIRKKSEQVFQFIQSIQQLQTYSTITSILQYIYYDLGYYYYVEAMPDGRSRSRNLELFLEQAGGFEHASFKSVFDFLMFVDKIQKKSIVLGGEPSLEDNENVVRIMSIHKSKGLEFPVVFLSGTGKNFNLMDAKTPLIVHSDYFLGAKYIDVEKRCGNDTFSRKAFAALMLTESIAEELRIFYVGLTRAKEKLVITGVTPDIPALIKRYAHIAGKKETKLSYSVVHTARNYLDLLVAAFIRNEAFYEAMKKVRKRKDKKGESISTAEYDQPFFIQQPQIFLDVQVYDYRNFAVSHIQSGLEKQLEKKGIMEEWEKMPAPNQKRIEQNFAWQYTAKQLVNQKSKLSVTEIKRIYETDYEPSDVILKEQESLEDYVAPLPAFIAGEKELTAADKGTWMHKTMELLDFVAVSTKQQAEEALENMRKTGRIPEETASFITKEKIITLLESDLGKRMKAAAQKGLLYKEQQFVVGVTVERLLKEKEQNRENQVVVQGIIDAYFKEGNNLILIDYKTDRVRRGKEQVLVDRYRTQMQYYKDTLEQLTGLTVSETYLYSFSLGKEIYVAF